MTGRIWMMLMLAGCMFGGVSGRSDAAAQALMNSGRDAVELVVELTGSMVLWSGLMAQLEASGDVKRLGRVIRRVMSRLFPGVKDEEACAAAGMNLAANLFGLGNAATPAGVRAAKLLSGQGSDGLRALALLLALNNSGLQLMPTTVIALRSAAGAADPADIWLPTLLSSGAATVTALTLMLVLNRRRKSECREN